MKAKADTPYKVIRYLWTIKEDHNGDLYRDTTQTIWEYSNYEEAGNKYRHLACTEEVGKGFVQLIEDGEVISEENF
jgi:hypothetical protein